MFSDPMENGVLKLHNVGPWGEYSKGGGIAAYNLAGLRQPYTFRPADIPDIEVSDTYWVYNILSHYQKFNRRCSQYDYDQYLNEQNCGHSIQEIPAQRLVAEKVHTYNRTDAAAYYCQHKKGGLRNAP